MVHVGQPRLGAAGQRKSHVRDLHRLAVAVGQTLLDLVVALNVNDAARRTCRAHHSGRQAVEDGADVKDDFNHREQGVVEKLGDGVEVRVVEIHAVDAG